MSYGVGVRVIAARRMAGWSVVAALAAMWCGACGRTDATSAATTIDVAHTGPARELAVSQVTGKTVAPPPLVEPCASDVVAIADGTPAEGADQVVDLVNRGAVRCDVDISASPAASVDMEPSVVLGPGEVGHLWASGRDDCDRSLADPQAEFEVNVNGVARSVATTFVAYCGVELWAFFTE